MHWSRSNVTAAMVAIALVAVSVYLSWNAGLLWTEPVKHQNPTSLASSPKEPMNTPPDKQSRVPQVAAAFDQLVRTTTRNGTVDFGKITKDFAESGFKELSSGDMLKVLETVDFGDPAGETQGPAFLLENAAEILRDLAGESDVKWVAQRLRESSSKVEVTKWLKVLDLMSREENQAAYIALLKDLPAGEPGATLEAEAELVGRVLGQIGSEQTVAALLAAAADEQSTKQLAVTASIGHVQDPRAIKPIAELIDGPGNKTHRQVAAAVEMLGYIPSEYSVMSLRNLSSDSDEEIASMAKQSLKLLMSNNPGLKSVANP